MALWAEAAASAAGASACWAIAAWARQRARGVRANRRAWQTEGMACAKVRAALDARAAREGWKGMDVPLESEQNAECTGSRDVPGRWLAEGDGL